MSAVLRQGARRIGGALLQRTRAAVTSPAVAQKRMLSTDKLPSRVQAGNYVKERCMSLQHTNEAIHQKMEELYDVLSRAKNLRDRVLLQDLVGHIHPRPHDNQWRSLRMYRKISNFVVTSGTAVFVSLAVVASSVNGIYDAALKRVAMEKENQLKKRIAMGRESQVETMMDKQV